MQFEFGLSGKWLKLLKHVAPEVTRAAAADHSRKREPRPSELKGRGIGTSQNADVAEALSSRPRAPRCCASSRVRRPRFSRCWIRGVGVVPLSVVIGFRDQPRTSEQPPSDSGRNACAAGILARNL